MFDSLTSEANRLLKAMGGVGERTIVWQRPQDANHGDLSTNIALQLGGVLKRPPRSIAEDLVKRFGRLPDIEKIEVAGAGYINIWLTPAALLRELAVTRKACTPAVMRTKEKPIIIEGSDPNIAKPLGIHHILSTILGQCLTNLYRHAGFNVLQWNYIGDWGTQFGKLAVAIEKWGDAKKATVDYTIDELLALYVRFHEEAEKDPALEDLGREAFRRLEKGDPTLRAFWEDVVAITKTELAALYERLHVCYDIELGESFYNDKMGPILEEGISKGVFKEGERGALIVEFPEELGLPVYMVRRSDGATLYSTRDIAQMRYRIDTYDPMEINIPTDVSQTLHFQQLFATCRMLGWTLPKLEHVVFGRMRFADQKMSTRKGTVLKLEHVLDEAVTRAEAVIKEHEEHIEAEEPGTLAEMMGVGAIVYGILSQNRTMNIVFDWDKMLSFDGNSAPYLQYTHARARSVMRKAEVDTGALSPDVSVLGDHERTLLQTLLQFSSVLEESRSEHLPHKLAHYLYGLCQDFNAFYNSSPILKAEEHERQLRLHLTHCTATVLKTGAELLTLRVPERM